MEMNCQHMCGKLCFPCGHRVGHPARKGGEYHGHAGVRELLVQRIYHRVQKNDGGDQAGVETLAFGIEVGQDCESHAVEEDDPGQSHGTITFE